MTATDPYYYGWEVICEWAVEAAGSYGTTPGSGDFVGMSLLRDVSINVNENLTRISTAGIAVGLWAQTEVKGLHVATATLNFWMPDDMSSSVNETWILKLPLDEYNTAHDATIWEVPQVLGTLGLAYGSNSLQSFTFEMIFAKATDERGWRLSGCYVNRFTLTINKGEPILFTYEIVARNAEHITDMTNGGATVLAPDSVYPLSWNCVGVTWTGETGSATVTDFTNITLTWENNMEPNYDIVNSSATAPRIPSEFILGYNGGRRITGTMTVNRVTTANHFWEEILLSATASQTLPDSTIQLGELKLTVNSIITSTKKFEYTLYEVTIGELPQDIDFSKVQEVTLPIEARYYLWQFTTADSSNEPTLWDDQQ